MIPGWAWTLWAFGTVAVFAVLLVWLAAHVVQIAV